MFRTRLVAAAFLLCSLALVTASAAQESALGRIAFPTSGSPEAQKHFLRGVLALHSFWYEEALDEFRAATQAEPGFAMGYWGEAFAHTHLLWDQQDAEAGRKVLAKIPPDARMTPRERAYIDAVRVLYGEGEKKTILKSFAAAMERVSRDYPDDREAACFYSVALIAVYGYKTEGHNERMRAGSIALQVLAENPDHPGAAHYAIHAFDDPEHAILALSAARRYAQIAPEAHHARHMPSHIFIQLGMWPEAAASNQSAWEASVAWVTRKNLPIGLRDYHSFHWLFYVLLQQGRFAEAERVFTKKRADMAEPHPASTSEYGAWTPDRAYPFMAAAYVLETGRTDLLKDAFTLPERKEAEASGGAHVHGAGAASAPSRESMLRTLEAYTRGLMASADDRATRKQSMDALRKARSETKDGERAKIIEIMELCVTAQDQAARGRMDDAITAMTAATKLEDSLPAPSGPPDLMKPSHEQFGELLLRAGKPRAAVEQFHISLARQPNRPRSLLGAARAAAKAGDAAGAAAMYTKLLEVWKQADAQLAELAEARAYVQQQGTRAGAGAGR